MSIYSEKLKDPRWQKKRLKVLERDNWTCQSCNATEFELQIHHLSYKGNPWDQNDDKLKTVCKFCHEFIEVFKSHKFIFKGGFVKKFYNSDRTHHVSFFTDTSRDENFISIGEIKDGNIYHLTSLTEIDFLKFKDFLSKDNG